MLFEHRAWMLAALGRGAEADAELATLAATYSDYPAVLRGGFVVRLLGALRRGDVSLAADIAATRTSEMPLDLPTDLLADVVLAASGRPMAEDEHRRIAAELGDMTAIATWIERVAPGLIARARLGVRIDVSHEAVASEEEEEEDSDPDDARSSA
jgi:hypothetical protein